MLKPALVFVFLGLSMSSGSASLNREEFETINVNGNFFEVYTFSNLSDRISYSFFYNYSQCLTQDPPRVEVTLISPKTDNIDDALLVFVKHRSGVMSWQLPSIQKNGIRIDESAHTLPPSLNNTNNSISEIVVNLSTYSQSNVTFSISLNISKNFSVPLDQHISFKVSVEKPVYYYHAFKKDIDMVLINVTSNDDICMTLSIQNASHPVSDTLETVQYNGLRQTVSTNGGIIVSKKEYPLGLFLVFVVHSDDSVCIKKNPDPDPEVRRSSRSKIVTFNISKTVNFNLQLMSWVLIILIFVWILLMTAVFYHNKKNILDIPNTIPEEPSSSIGSNTVHNPSDYESSDSSSEDNEQLTSQDPKLISRHCIRTKKCLYVSDLSMKNHRRLDSKSKLYLWNLITVAVFYSLPVVQLVFTFQKVLNDSGNQDLCYYNFLCSHSLIIGNVKFTDFNHLFSNIGYIFFGILFILITYKRERAYVPIKHYGIPRHSGLYYSMGSALAIEGLMSACYHICPNHSNIQFDTSFMYIICMLCMIKIYQTRHPDINANSYFIFGMLAFVIILGLAGIMFDGLLFSIFFTIIHLTMSFWLSAHIYYMSAWKLDKKTPKRFFEYIKSAPNPFKPKYLNRMVLLSIGLLINFGVAISHIINSKMYSNFSNYLLTLFMVNLMLYLIFYMVMKLISKEKILFWPLLYLILAILSWSAAIFFFTHRSSSWDLTAAQSRKYNTPCSYLELFDNHDMWHFLSALGLILSFMLLLTLDDDLINKPTATIPVF